MTHRLAQWANRKLLPALLAVLLLADLFVGGNWLLAPPSSLTGVVYNTAKLLMPMEWYGAAFLVVGGVACTMLARYGRCRTCGALVGLALGGMWAFWTVLFILAPLGHVGASYLGAIVTAAFTALHLLAGLAVTRRAAERT